MLISNLLFILESTDIEGSIPICHSKKYKGEGLIYQEESIEKT